MTFIEIEDIEPVEEEDGGKSSGSRGGSCAAATRSKARMGTSRTVSACGVAPTVWGAQRSASARYSE